ncbi:MAG: arsenate reductase ArsC [Ignavibacteriae bacterium]|nr:MAG: arsenate reductase ArsC [Ignavibacteriota bacterium]
MKNKILIICTGNSCRSQMAEGYLRSLDHELEIYSAGTKPEIKINPNAVEVMKEIGIDINNQYPKNVNDFVLMNFDYVITVCDSAKETCPYFAGNVKHRVHLGFEDPADAEGSKEEVLSVYRKVRDQIREEFKKFYESIPDNINKEERM